MAKTNNGVKFSLFAVTLLLLSAAVVPVLAQFGGGGGGFGGGGFGFPQDSFDDKNREDFGPPPDEFGRDSGVRGGVRGGQQRMMRGAPQMDQGIGPQMGPPPMGPPMGGPGFGGPGPGGNPFSGIRVNAKNVRAAIEMLQNACDMSEIDCPELDGLDSPLDDFEEALEAARSDLEDNYLDPSDPADRAELKGLKKAYKTAQSALKKAQQELAKKIKSLLPVFKQRFKEARRAEQDEEKTSREEHLKEREERLKAIKEDDAMRRRESEIRQREYEQSFQQPSIMPAPSVDAASKIPAQ